MAKADSLWPSSSASSSFCRPMHKYESAQCCFRTTGSHLSTRGPGQTWTHYTLHGWPGFLRTGVDIWAGMFFGVGCWAMIVGYLAIPLGPTQDGWQHPHQHPTPTPPSCDNQKCLQRVPNISGPKSPLVETQCLSYCCGVISRVF